MLLQLTVIQTWINYDILDQMLWQKQKGTFAVYIVGSVIELYYQYSCKRCSFLEYFRSYRLVWATWSREVDP